MRAAIAEGHVKRGLPLVWRRVGGDNINIHLFVQGGPQWWAHCGVGPGVGQNERDTVLDPCPTCFEFEVINAR